MSCVWALTMVGRANTISVSIPCDWTWTPTDAAGGSSQQAASITWKLHMEWFQFLYKRLDPDLFTSSNFNFEHTTPHLESFSWTWGVTWTCCWHGEKKIRQEWLEGKALPNLVHKRRSKPQHCTHFQLCLNTALHANSVLYTSLTHCMWVTLIQTLELDMLGTIYKVVLGLILAIATFPQPLISLLKIQRTIGWMTCRILQ